MIKYMVIDSLDQIFDYVLIFKLELGEFDTERQTYPVLNSTVIIEFHPEQNTGEFGSLQGANLSQRIFNTLYDESNWQYEFDKAMSRRAHIYTGRKQQAEKHLVVLQAYWQKTLAELLMAAP